MEGHLAYFLKEIGALRVIENKFEDYLENVKDKGTEYVCSAIVVPLKYEYSTFTKDFRKTEVRTFTVRDVKHFVFSRITATFSHSKSTLL